jgi:hypothetical protein
MMTADPLGHLAHGMAQATPEPTFAGKSLDQVVKEAMAAQEPDGELEFDSEEIDLPKPKNKGGRPRKA